MKFQEIKEKSSEYLFQNYGRIDLSFTHGKGCYLYGSDGKEYLDMVAGIAVNCLGYAHPEWVAAMQKQISELVHVSNLYYVEEQAELAEKVAGIAPKGLDRTLFVNSGAEANEGALKLAVRATGRHKVVSALNGFHGRTSAALGATGQTKYQASFEPLISHAYSYYDYNDLESVKSIVDKDTAALLVETIQGEGGVIPATDEFLHGVRDLCSDTGTVMIVDEVQTGIGRTGKWFSVEHSKIVPDIMTLAKGLGGGMPIGAVVSSEELSKVMTPGTHGTTFGGNPMVCASGCSVIDIMKKEKLVENSEIVGSELKVAIAKIASPKIKDVRGKGMIIGVEMDCDDTAKAVQKYMRDNGVLINVCHGKTVRLIPPLIFGRKEMDVFMKCFNEAIQ